MPKRTDIHRILVIGSGPIVIGQAAEFDRECWFMTDGSVRGGITWDDLCRIQLPVPPYERQLDVVESYRAITRRIAMKKEINDNLAA